MICSVCRRIGGTHFRPLFMPATQSFCPLRKIFARFSDFWSRVTFYRRFARFLRQICGWTTPVGLTCCYDSSSCHQSIPPRGGGHSPGFIVPTVEPHRKVRWRAVARRSSQLKPYLPALPSSFLGGRGPFPPFKFGPTGRVLLALLLLIAYA